MGIQASIVADALAIPDVIFANANSRIILIAKKAADFTIDGD